MAFSHGSKGTFRTGTLALPTTLTDISDYIDSISQSRPRDVAETTVMKKTAKTYVAGLVDGSFSLEGQTDNTVDLILHDLMTTGEVDFEYCPQGFGVTGTPKFTGKWLITSLELTSDIGDANQWSAEGQISGVVTRTIQ